MKVTKAELDHLEHLKTLHPKYSLVVVPTYLYLQLLIHAKPAVPRRCKRCNGYIEHHICVSCRTPESL